MKQWRVVYRSALKPNQHATCFVDAATEEAARALFAQAFPRAVLESIRLEPVSPCAAYERRAP